MEDLLAKALKLLDERSIYNKTDKQIKESCQTLFQFVFDNATRPNVLKLLRFCEDIDPSGYQHLCQVSLQLRNEHMNKVYKASLRQLHGDLSKVQTNQNVFQQTIDKSAAYASQIERFASQHIEQNLRVLGLQQARLRYASVSSIYAQLKQAAQMLSESASSKTVLEQKYFHLEFARLSKKLKVKFLQDYASEQASFDLHDTMLIQDVMSQLQANNGFEHYKQLFLKCFGAHKFYETFHRAAIEFAEQAFHARREANELDQQALLFQLVKFLAFEQVQLSQQEVELRVNADVPAQAISSRDDETQLQPSALAEIVARDLDTISALCLKYVQKVVAFFVEQPLLSTEQVIRMLLLLAKISLQIEGFYQQLETFKQLDQNKIALAQQAMYKQISALIQHAIEVFRGKLKQKFLVKSDSFDKWISVEHSDSIFNQVQMHSLQEVSPTIDPTFILQLMTKLDRLKQSNESELTVFTSCIYAYALNQPIEQYMTDLQKNPNFIPTKTGQKLEVLNIQIVPLHFYHTLNYINEFLYFIQMYEPDFDVNLIIGSTVNCITGLILPPQMIEKQKNIPAKELPFILDECLLVSQIKLISIFAELVEYERIMFSYYLKSTYPNMLYTYIQPVIRRMFAYQINFKNALRSTVEYSQTTTVTNGCKVIFDRFLYLSKIIQSFPRISQLIMETILQQLELNIIDHYSYLKFTPNTLEVMNQEVEYLRQTFNGMFSLDTFQCISEFILLPISQKEKFEEFRKKFGSLFDPIKFKEIMMRVGAWTSDRDGVLAVVKQFPIK